MDLNRWWLELHAFALRYWSVLDSSQQFYVWLSSGALFFLAWGWFSYHVIRRTMGHRRMHGRWYNPLEWEQLMQMLFEQQMANRVLHWEEISALREYKTGSKNGLFNH